VKGVLQSQTGRTFFIHGREDCWVTVGSFSVFASYGFFLASIPIVDEYIRFRQIANLKIFIEACACIPLLCVEVILMWKANDIFGVVVEYKMLLVATLVDVIFISSLELITAIKHSYYKIIIEFVSTTYIICFYFLWLKSYIKSFNIHNEGFGSAS